jgi:hypothetical protein
MDILLGLIIICCLMIGIFFDSWVRLWMGIVSIICTIILMILTNMAPIITETWEIRDILKIGNQEYLFDKPVKFVTIDYNYHWMIFLSYKQHLVITKIEEK